MSDLRWSTPTRDDDEAWADLLAAIEAVDERGEVYELDDLDDEWESVWSDPANGARFVWDGDLLVAFAWNKAVPGTRATHRVACWGGVRPSHRGRGIGRQVMAWQLERGREVAAGFDPDLPTSIEVDALDTQPDVMALAARLGFVPARRFLDLARPVWSPVPDVSAPGGLALREWTEELDEQVRLGHAEAFAQHWGSEPRGPEEWRQWYTGHRAFRPDISRIALDGDQVVGFVLCAAYPQDWEVVPREAWINTVGTIPEMRGRGVAKWLMAEVLSLIEDADDEFERAILGVDAANSTGALQLYRSLGFEQVKASSVLAVTA